MESAGRKHHGLGGAERASLPALEKAPADETALRETADMMKGVGARVKELSETLASLGGACEQTAELMERLADVRGRSFAMRHATQKLAGAAGAMQTETERSLLALKSVKLGRTLKEIHALARWAAQEANLFLRQVSSEPCRGMTVKHEVSVVRDGRGFGKEAAELLRGIEEIGSLKGAIAGIQMGFGPAWRMLRDIERRLGFPLLERKIGGASGGGSRLTPEARDLMRRYEALSQDVEEALQEIYAKHFG
jgi:molybdate transport system regulatory protein